MVQPIPDADALLCEHCGYSIAGLAEATPCPECAALAGSSWPGTRPGTIYQRRAAPGRWLWGNFEVLWRPRRAFRAMRIERRLSVRMLMMNLMATGGLVVVGYWLASGRMWFDASLALWIGTLGGLLLLTFIETLGLRFFARAESRRWRITPDVAWSVCGHASVGWLIGGALMFTVFALDPAGRLMEWRWLNSWLYKRNVGPLYDHAGTLRMVQLLVPFVVGVVAFETLVYIGTRRCRFANAPASATQQGAALRRAESDARAASA